MVYNGPVTICVNRPIKEWSGIYVGMAPQAQCWVNLLKVGERFIVLLSVVVDFPCDDEAKRINIC